MRFHTEITIPQPNRKIDYLSPIFSIGSCFSTEIGSKMARLKYKVLQNPCGITFNPISMVSCVRACLSGNSLPESEHIFHNSLWCHPDFHGSFNHTDKIKHQELINNSLFKASQYLTTTQIFIITLGTSFVYRYQSTNRIVNNCHKMPDNVFQKELLETSEILKALVEVKDLVESHASHPVQFVITVSPIRHLRDGLVENQRSKSRALEASHQFAELAENIQYFPSYEIMMDDLRDYRFYNEDMIHPTPQAVNYIYDIFEKHYLEEKESSIRARIQNINNSLGHKPLFPDSENHQVFKNQLLNKIEKIESEFPHISYEQEKKKLLDNSLRG